MTQASIGAQGGLNLFQTVRPAMLDFQMKGTEVNVFTVNGLNALSKTRVVYADGSEGSETNIHWGYVVGGIVAAGVIINQLDDDDGNSGFDPGDVGIQ